MELMEGSSLEKLYRGHVVPYSKLLEMGVQLAMPSMSRTAKEFCIAISSLPISL